MVKYVAALSLALALSWSSPAAEACINPMRIAKDKGVQMVVKAQGQLDAGASKDALATIDPEGELRENGHLHYDTGDEALQARAMLLGATAWLRTATAEERPRVMALLERLRKDDRDHPLLIARVAEALAGGDEGERGRALALLGDLEVRDLLPDAEAVAALARLRTAAGDREGVARALARCGKLARRPDVCPAASPAPTTRQAPTRPRRPARRRSA